MRVGNGFDAHRFSAAGSIIVGGVVVDDTRGVEATSDGDVLAHAVADALLGAAAVGDLGDLFPSSDPTWVDADSMALLSTVVRRLDGLGYRVASVDVTVIAEKVRISPHRAAIRSNLAAVLMVSGDAVSVKATTTDGLGFLGRDEGIAALAIACMERSG
jgi:2-C-methyl-D-erythritol 2,4-cyclodiphosphate synthase